MSLFADDLLYVTDPLTSIPSIINESFGHFSNFKVNYSKSEILNITFPTPLLQQLCQDFPFRIRRDSLKYLGVQVPAEPSLLFELNYKPLLSRTLKDLQSDDRSTFSWFRRINILKMEILLRFLYLFQLTPILLPPQYFKMLHRAFRKFIWGRTHPRINASTLSRPKSLGSTGLPDLSAYHAAAVFTRLVDWFHCASTKQWVSLEFFLSPIDRALCGYTPTCVLGLHHSRPSRAT